MARCSGPKGPAPATPPFDRSQGGCDHCGSALAREICDAPPAPRRSRGLTPAAPAETCHRHLSPASASRHKGRGRSASTCLPALCGSPRRAPRTTLSRPHSAAMQDMDSVARNHLARCAGRRAAPVGASARGPPLRDRSCHARAAPRALPRKSKEPAGWSGGLPKTAPRRPRA